MIIYAVYQKKCFETRKMTENNNNSTTTQQQYITQRRTRSGSPNVSSLRARPAIPLIMHTSRDCGSETAMTILVSSVCYIWQQRYLTCSFDCYHQTSLMLGTYAGCPAGQDFAALGYAFTQFCYVFVVNILNLVYAKLAYFSFTFMTVWS